KGWILGECLKQLIMQHFHLTLSAMANMKVHGMIRTRRLRPSGLSFTEWAQMQYVVLQLLQQILRRLFVEELELDGVESILLGQRFVVQVEQMNVIAPLLAPCR